MDRLHGQPRRRLPARLPLDDARRHRRRLYGETQDESPRLAPFYPRGFAHHYWGPEALSDLAAGELLLVFVDSMSDLLAPAVPAEQVRAVLAVMRAAPSHAYQSLTKAAPPLLRYAADLPPNLWVGVSAPPDAMLDRALTREQRRRMLARTLDALARVKAATGNLVWLSAERLSWDMAEVLTPDHPLDRVVIRAASKGRQTYQPAPDHLRRPLEVLDATATPVFFKGNVRPSLQAGVLDRWREDFPARYGDGGPIPAVDRRQRLFAVYGWTPSIAAGRRALLPAPCGASDTGHSAARAPPVRRAACEPDGPNPYERWNTSQNISGQKTGVQGMETGPFRDGTGPTWPQTCPVGVFPRPGGTSGRQPTDDRKFMAGQAVTASAGR